MEELVQECKSTVKEKGLYRNMKALRKRRAYAGIENVIHDM